MPRARPTPTAVAIVALLTAQPIVGFAAANNYDIPDLGKLVAVAAACSGIAVLVLVCIVRWTSIDAYRAGPVVGVVAYLLLTPGTYLGPQVDGGAPAALRAGTWALIIVLVAVLVYRLTQFEWFRSALLIFAALFTALPLASVVSYRISLRDSPLPDLASSDAPLPAGSPNVYWLVLDEYARPDVVEKHTGLQLDAFVGDLEARGFDVSSTSTGAYTRTQQSLASTLAGDYVFQPGTAYANEFLTAAGIVRGANPTVDRFTSSGYRFVYGDSGLTGWASCESPPADRCVPTVGGVFDSDDVGLSLMQTTALVFTSLPDYARQDLDVAGDVLVDEAGGEQPVFAFIHVMSPHWPFRYEPDCSELVPAERYAALSVDARRHRYRDQITCLNAEVLQLVDRIVAVDPEALIIIQGDHGSSFGVNFDWPPEAWTSEALAERLAPFNAMRLPQRCQDDDRYAIEGQALVNTFRIVFACLEGTDPELLEPRAYLSSYNSIDDLVEVDVPRPPDG